MCFLTMALSDYYKCMFCDLRQFEKKATGVSFHSLPADNEKRFKWFRALGLPDNTKVNTRTRICSKHFSDYHYSCGSDGQKARKYLRKSAIPTLQPTVAPPSATVSFSLFCFLNEYLIPFVSMKFPRRVQ